MPECLLLAYYANLDRLRAERQLDAGQAASVPHLSKEGHQSWYKHVSGRASRPVVATGGADGSTGGPALFTVNGQATDKAGLARWLALTFGGSPFTHPAPRADAPNGRAP
jgi:hypothetical protein